MPTIVNTNVNKTGSLATTANTANQEILTYTVPAGSTLALQYFEANVRLTTFATTATNFGTLSLRRNGTALQTFMAAGPGVLNSPVYMELPDPLLFQAGDVITVVCTPGAATGYTWESNICGWLK